MRAPRLAHTVVAFAIGPGGLTTAGAQGLVRVSPTRLEVEIPIGHSAHDTWKWNDPATPDGRAEYVWSARSDGDSTLMAQMFARSPTSIAFLIRSPYGEAPPRRVPVTYDPY